MHVSPTYLSQAVCHSYAVHFYLSMLTTALTPHSTIHCFITLQAALVVLLNYSLYHPQRHVKAYALSASFQCLDDSMSFHRSQIKIFITHASVQALFFSGCGAGQRQPCSSMHTSLLSMLHSWMPIAHGAL
jgi:hypothetical protein